MSEVPETPHKAGRPKGIPVTAEARMSATMKALCADRDRRARIAVKRQAPAWAPPAEHATWFRKMRRAGIGKVDARTMVEQTVGLAE